MDRWDDLEAFVAIVEQGSQTAAAKQLKRSLQSIGRSLIALERSVGVELVRRSTRRSSPTAAGQAFYRRLKPALFEIGQARREAATQHTEPVGVLRIAAPVLFASNYVVPVIGDFMRRYAQVEVELKTSDRSVDLDAERLDLAIRMRELPDSGLKARRVGELRIVVFGAPAYFAEHARPAHPEELVRHQCILRNADPDAGRWAFRIRGKRELIRVAGRFRTDDAASTHAAVAAGLGLGIAPLWQIRPWIERGAVELVLEGFETAKLPVYAVSPATKLPLAKTRLFTDMLAARLKRERL
jgi:DNA-binding transcriptional LysR family regulator